MKKATLLFSAWSLCAAACAADSHAEQVRDARMERTDAESQEQMSAVEGNADARDQQTDHAYDKREDNIEAAHQPGTEPSKELNELSKDRAEYQTQAQEKLDKLAVRIDASQKKLTILGTRAPSTLKSELSTAQTQHGTLKREISELGVTTDDKWDGAKARVERDLSDLDTRLSNLSDKIDDV